MSFKVTLYLIMALLLTGNAIDAQPDADTRIHVLIVDGFSNHDWRQTSLLTRRILEETGRFAVDISTAPGTVDDPGWADWNPEFKKYAVVIQKYQQYSNSYPSLAEKGRAAIRGICEKRRRIIHSSFRQ